MPSKDTTYPYQLQTGEVILRQMVRHLGPTTQIGDIPSPMFEILGNLWIKNTGLRWFQGPLNSCWVYKTRGDQNANGYPRIYRWRNGRYGKTSLRRYIAELMFDMPDEIDGKEIKVIMDCKNIDCVNPRHMRFADHPNPKLED